MKRIGACDSFKCCVRCTKQTITMNSQSLPALQLKDLGFKAYFQFQSAMESLRSSVWSSETLLEGMKNVSAQPDNFLAKVEDESDQELVDQYKVPQLDFFGFSLCFFWICESLGFKPLVDILPSKTWAAELA